MHIVNNDLINPILIAKILAIIMVVTAHFYMSMRQVGWVSKDAVYYILPIQVAYCVPVQIFFVCSGFLYQLFKKESLKNVEELVVHV